MTPRGLPCALGDHRLDKPVYVTDPKLITFIRKRHLEFRPQEEVCRKCLKTIQLVYNEKKRRALQRTRELPSVSSTSDSGSQRSVRNTESSSSTLQSQHTRISDFSSSSNDNDEYMPSPNALNGNVRMPHVQPIIRRNLLVRLNEDVMQAYTAGIIGG